MPESGSPGALEEALYRELRAIAGSLMRSQRRDHTLQPTTLVSQAYLNLAGRGFDSIPRAEYLALAATVMRRILIDHARRKGATKRGGNDGRAAVIIPINETCIADEAGLSGIDVLALHEALEILARHSPRQARVVELRYFGGLSVDEVAQVIGVSKRTIEADWTFAKAWLSREFQR